MKINLTEHFRKHTRISSIVLHNLTYTLKNKIDLDIFADKNRNEKGDIIVNLKLTMNDIELDLESYIERWDKSVDEYINEKLSEHVFNFMDGKFVDIKDLLNDLQERIKPEIKKRFEEWEIEEKH